MKLRVARGGIHLALQHVHLGLRKIRQAPGVVEIQVGEDDMAHVLGGETEPVQLFQRGVARLQADVFEHPEEPAEAITRTLHVAAAEAGIHQHQPVLLGLEQQAMANQLRRQPLAEAIEQGAAERAHAAAVQVMDAHGHPSLDEPTGSPGSMSSEAVPRAGVQPAGMRTLSAATR